MLVHHPEGINGINPAPRVWSTLHLEVNQGCQVFQTPHILGINKFKLWLFFPENYCTSDLGLVGLPQPSSCVHVHVYVIVVVIIVVVVIVVIVSIAVAIDISYEICRKVEGDHQKRKETEC